MTVSTLFHTSKNYSRSLQCPTNYTKYIVGYHHPRRCGHAAIIQFVLFMTGNCDVIYTVAAAAVVQWALQKRAVYRVIVYFIFKIDICEGLNN